MGYMNGDMSQKITNFNNFKFVKFEEMPSNRCHIAEMGNGGAVRDA